jgi:hypothetical protein
MSASKNNNVAGKRAKLVFGGIGFALFMILAISNALEAHHYQVIGQPMPNGKGGFMTFRDGYVLALALAGLSMGFLLLMFNARQRV